MVSPRIPASSASLSAMSAQLSVERTEPSPWQVGQTCEESSCRLGRSRWRDSSRRPNMLIRPSWMRARSIFRASRIRFSTER